MPVPLSVSCFSKIQTGSSFLVLAHVGSPRQRAVKWVCVTEIKPKSDWNLSIPSGLNKSVFSFLLQLETSLSFADEWCAAVTLLVGAWWLLRLALSLLIMANGARMMEQTHGQTNGRRDARPFSDMLQCRCWWAPNACCAWHCHYRSWRMAREWWDRWTDRRRDARPFHRPCCAYYASSVSYCNTTKIISVSTVELLMILVVL